MVLDEASRGDILRYCNIPIVDKLSLKEQTKFDLGRVEYQILMEQKLINSSGKDFVIIDKSVPCLLLYVLLYASRYVHSSTINALVDEVSSHCNQMYDLVAYLPFLNFNTSDDGLNRNVTNIHVLEAQDVVLRHMIGKMTLSDFIVLRNDSRRARERHVLQRIEASDVVYHN